VRERRQDYPIRIYELDDQPGENLSASTSAEERLAMVWELTVGAWEVAGLPFPDYSRDQAPVSWETLGLNKRSAGRLKDLANLEALGEGLD